MLHHIHILVRTVVREIVLYSCIYGILNWQSTRWLPRYRGTRTRRARQPQTAKASAVVVVVAMHAQATAELRQTRARVFVTRHARGSSRLNTAMRTGALSVLSELSGREGR